MHNIEELIARQQDTFESIKKITINFKKDSASRKTTEYLEKRMEVLNAHWSVFEQNDKLINATENKGITYFQEDVFNKTKQMYTTTLNEMQRMHDELTSALRTTHLGAPGPSTRAPSETRDFQENEGSADTAARPTSSQLLMQQQQCQFMAFERAVSKIDIEAMTEKWDLEDSLNLIKARWEAIDKLHWKIVFAGPDTQYQTTTKMSRAAKKDQRRDLLGTAILPC